MDTLEVVKQVAQIVYYIALSIAGPLGVITYLQAKKREQEEREYKTYDELDRKFFEYQKLALEYYDLDILDVPNNDPSLAFDKKRKQEQVAYAILFSLFERAYLMFSHQTDTFKRKQWSGWKHFLNDFIRREGIRTAWEMGKATYDMDFQAFMDKRIAEILAAHPIPKPVAAKPAAAPVAEPVGSIADAAPARAHSQEEQAAPNQPAEDE